MRTSLSLQYNARGCICASSSSRVGTYWTNLTKLLHITSGKNSRYFHTQKGMKQTHKGMKNHRFSRKHVFHTLKRHFIPVCNCFIPCAHFSYLGHIFHTLCICFIPWYYFSYLLGCEFIPKLFNFIPLTRFFHTLGITISYLLQSVSHPEQIYSYPNWTIHNPGWTLNTLVRLGY